jgi:erythronate-4-phosphate dehydrogenase
MKIVADENIPFLREAFGDFGEIVTLSGRAIDHEALQDASMLLVRSVTAVNESLLAGTPVKFVATATIGTDHIDIGYLERENIGFASAPGSNADSVAEYVIAALMNLFRQKGISRADKTIGIIGCGNVGSRVFKRAQTLGMRCLVCDPPKKRISGSDFFRPRAEVLAESDIVTVHVPLTDEGEDATFHMVNAEFLSALKPGAILINTSRGKVHEEKALRAYSDKLGGVILDVWEHEPRVSPEMIARADIATPHIAGYSYDGKVRGTAMIYQAACAFFFRESRWNWRETIALERGKAIDISHSSEPVADAVLGAYPIGEDDARMRDLIQLDTTRRAAAFDDLRKRYPRRLEFSHFAVQAEALGESDRQILQALGFDCRAAAS